MVIEVLDARCPMASSNPMVESLRMARQRPCLKVLNKADVADAQATPQWISHFNALKNTQAIALSAKKPGDAQKIIAAAKKLAPHRNENLKPLRMLIMGVPNVGKSTLVNALLKQRRAKVGDEPAITKSLARYELSPTVSLTDTPGLMWPKIDHPGLYRIRSGDFPRRAADLPLPEAAGRALRHAGRWRRTGWCRCHRGRRRKTRFPHQGRRHRF